MSSERKDNPATVKHKFRTYATTVCNILEIVAAVLVLVAVAFALLSLIPDLGVIWDARGSQVSFVEFLEKIFSIVIGIEFMKMLCHPDSDNVLEIMIFLIARHMIITTTTPLEDMISTISIVILCLARYFLKLQKVKEH